VSAAAGTVLLGLGFFFTFTAWHSAQNLQSSLPLHAGVSGTTALGIVYSLLPVGYVLAPSIVRQVGLKAAIVVPMCMYGTFIAANMFPRWWTLYPAACNVGLACGPMFVAQNTLLTRLALSYATDNGLAPTSRVGMFQGIFMSIFMTTQLVGNTFYALLFRMLGSHSAGGSGDDTPARSTIVLLFAIYTLFVLIGATLIGCGLQIPPLAAAEKEDEKPGVGQQSVKQGDEVPKRDLSAVLRLLRARKMQALLPLVLSTGFMGSFVTADFTALVVKPALGENNLGFIMAMVGGASVVANALCGRLSDSSGSASRVAIFVLALILNSAVSGLLCVRYLRL
jgi:MFS family permease